MAEYIGIKGSTIQSFSSDPPAPIEGQVWYNSTSNVLKGFGQFISSGVWASGGALNSAKAYAAGFSPTTSLAVQAGGSPPVPVGTDTCETYDGSTWTEVNAINTARRSLPGVGTQTSGLIIAGYAGGDVANVESWNGTCWAEETAVTTARRQAPGFGASSTSALLTASTAQVNTEVWNGSTWTEVVDPNSGRGQAAGSGIATSGMYAGGGPTPGWLNAETWDGTSWTTVANLLTGRGEEPGSAGVSGTDALIFGGRTPAPSWADVTFTEYFDGTSWTELADMAYARIVPARSGMGAGSTGALAVGGITPPATEITAVEEWSLPGATKTFTAS